MKNVLLSVIILAIVILAAAKVTYGTVFDGSQGVKRWEEVKKNQVPIKALDKIEKD